MNIFKRYKINNVFYICFSICFIILLAIVIWTSYSVSSKEMAKKMSFYQQKLLIQMNKKIDIQMKSIEQTSLETSRSLDLLEDLANVSDDSYERFRRNSRIESVLAEITYRSYIIELVSLYMVYPLDKEISGNLNIKDEKLMANEVWYPEIQNSDFAWIGEHSISTSKGSIPVISFARKIYSYNGQYLGTLVLHIKSSDIQQIISDEVEGGDRFLLDFRNSIMTHTLEDDSKDILIQSLCEHFDSNNGFIHLKKGQFEQFSFNEESLVVWSKSLNSNWMLVEVTPWGEITSGSKQIAYMLIGVGVGVIFITLLVSHLLTIQFTKPIMLLVNLMNNITLDTEKINLPKGYKNEFGLLFEGYTSQMQRIEELYQSLEEQHQKKRKAELRALQAMINPHFLYNTLDQLNWLAIESGNTRISEILEHMGKMFRIGLSNGADIIKIRQEIDHVEYYLKIQQLRWGEGLKYNIEIDEKLKELYVPKMILQPFVENSIIHGFHTRFDGEINISLIENSQGDLIFSIVDNGVGYEIDKLETKKRETGGFGINNVKERIDVYFGHEYCVEINSQPNVGTTVNIKVPKLLTQ